jgi:hypothetical protein
MHTCQCFFWHPLSWTSGTGAHELHQNWNVYTKELASAGGHHTYASCVPRGQTLLPSLIAHLQGAQGWDIYKI